MRIFTEVSIISIFPVIKAMLIHLSGHNDHTNEVGAYCWHNIKHAMTPHVTPSSQPSHHIPYMYSMAGAASQSQKRIREIAQENYNATSRGLSGVCCLCHFHMASSVADYVGVE